MKYNIKTDNYKTFSVYKDNVLKPRAYFIPFKSGKKMLKTDIRTERYNSDMVTVLSGEWDFKYYQKVSEMPSEIDTESIDFDKVTVPSCWQFTGYEPPVYINARYEFKPNPPKFPEDCSVGVYRRFFNAKKGKNHILTFLGVAGALDVFVNGKYVGYSEGSHNTSEFELNEFLIDGENELVAVVHKFSNGTYLECQDMFRNNGIFRDVLLTATGENSIYDFEVKTEYKDGKYDLTVLPSLKLSSECEFSAAIIEKELSKTVNVSPKKIEKISFTDLEVDEWSAEIPNLYTLIITLSKEGKITECIRKRIGFKHIEIKGNEFFFNNEKVKMLGVNHHDTNPKKGYAMSLEDMERDVKVFKEYNVNCVRTSHYPPDPAFLDFCDEYGVYVVDEADIETHGCGEAVRQGACSHNPAWQGHYWDRVYCMFERDKNHPSITMWSLGNEAWGYKNQDYCYEQLKKLSSIPIHYEGVIHTRRFAYDVISQMYPWQGKYRKVAEGKGLSKKWYEKPYFLSEYAHAMGLGAGELETYVSTFLSADNLMGGCIWEFADHAVYHEDGEFKYTYGGDHGEVRHDGNFCVDGLFFPDRTPHSGALQMKNCYRPVRAKKQEEGFEFTNLNYFKGVDYTVKWEHFDGSDKTENGEFELKLAPRESKKVNLGEIFETATFVFRYFDGDNEIASENHTAPVYPEYEKDKADIISAETDVTVNEDGIEVTVDGVKLVLGASIYRAPLDNDRYLTKAWDAMSLSAEHLKITGKTVKNNKLYVDAVIAGKKIKKLACVQFVIIKYADGSFDIKLRCPESKPIPFAPRFGLTVQLESEYDNVKYLGLGERENLPDFQEHAMFGEYSMKVDDMREKYIKPQESSMRCNVRWAEITDKNGKGLLFEGLKKPFIFSADRFTSHQCAKAKHQEELELQDLTFLHIDSYQLGAASGICGPPPTKNYRRNSVKGETLTVKIRRK